MTPLHVQVAEALGWDQDGGLHDWDEAPNGYKGCIRCGAQTSWEGEYDPALCVPQFDTDWSATGPLIEKHGFRLMPYKNEWEASWGVYSAVAGTPLRAVCHLVVNLHRQDRLGT